MFNRTWIFQSWTAAQTFSLETPPPIVFWTLNCTVLKIRFSNPIFQNKKEGWLQKSPCLLKWHIAVIMPWLFLHDFPATILHCRTIDGRMSLNFQRDIFSFFKEQCVCCLFLQFGVCLQIKTESRARFALSWFSVKYAIHEIFWLCSPNPWNSNFTGPKIHCALRVHLRWLLQCTIININLAR